MVSTTVLHYTLSIGFTILVIFICYTLYNLSEDLKILKRILLNAEEVSDDINSLKNFIKSSLTSIINLAKLFVQNGGEKKWRKKLKAKK